MDCINPDHDGSTSCAGCYAEAEREATRLRDSLQRMMNGASDDRKRTYAAAARTAHGHMVTWVQLYYLGPAMKQLTWPLEQVLGGLSVLDPAIGRTKEARARLEALAVRAKQAQQMYWDATKAAEPTWRADPREAEILRLRKVIEEHGQALHVKYAPPRDGFTACRCPGCELIVAMDAGTLVLEAAHASS